MIISKVQNKDFYLFKILIIIWILSIPFKNAIYQGSVILIILFFFYHLYKNKKTNILIENFHQTKILFVGFLTIVLSMILSNILNLELLGEKSWHMIYMFVIRYGLIFIILLYFYRLDFFTKKEIIIYVCISFLLLVFTGLYQLVRFPELTMMNGIVGSLNNRNAFGLFMGMAIVLSLIIMKNKKELAFLFIFICSFFMIFSFSRSSWIASTFAFVVFLIINYKKIKLSYFIYCLIFLVFILSLYLYFDSFQERFKSLLEGNSSDRIEIWTHTLIYIKEKIFFGYGMFSWNSLSDPFLNQYPDPHNMIFEILIYTGLLGLISCFFTISVVIIEIVKTKNFVLLPIVAYFIVVTQFDFGAYGSKEILSFLTIFIFFVYTEKIKEFK